MGLAVLSAVIEPHKAYSEAIEYCSSPDIVVLCNRSLARMKLEEPQNWLVLQNGERMMIEWLYSILIHMIWYGMIWHCLELADVVWIPYTFHALHPDSRQTFVQGHRGGVDGCAIGCCQSIQMQWTCHVGQGVAVELVEFEWRLWYLWNLV